MSRVFPGMDPFLEMPPFWSDFAPKLLTAISNQLLAKLLPKYDVRMEEYLLLTSDEVRLHRVQPDITISSSDWVPSGTVDAAVAVAEPTTAEMEYPDLEPLGQRHLNIIHRPTERVVTVMELLSPSNKTSGEGGLDNYLQKPSEFLASHTHLIEIDLLRGGQRLPMASPLPAGDYFVFVGRVGRKPRCQVIAWPLRAKLPPVPIPLLPEDPEATLDFDAAFAAAYEPSLYSRRLPYHEPLLPPLNDAASAWARERLEVAGMMLQKVRTSPE